eukprot:355789-Chlamydomonas_euryale.AAC.5
MGLGVERVWVESEGRDPTSQLSLACSCQCMERKGEEKREGGMDGTHAWDAVAHWKTLVHRPPCR